MVVVGSATVGKTFDEMSERAHGTRYTPLYKCFACLILFINNQVRTIKKCNKLPIKIKKNKNLTYAI